MSEERKLPLGVTHVTGNVYRVELSAIQFADGGFNRSSDQLEFKNLRHALADQKMAGQGLNKEDMTELRDRIRTEGLLHQPMLRWHGDGVQVVMGERRIRCLLRLVHDNTQCWSRDASSWMPAKELYGNINCEVHELDDQQAYKLSFSETESVKHFGDGARIAAITYFRSCGLKDKEIITITGLGPEWLNTADKLAGLGKVCFNALCNGEMSLHVAIKLMEYDDEARREELFSEWKKNATERWFKKQQELEAKDAKAEKSLAAATSAAKEVEDDAEELADSLQIEKAALGNVNDPSAKAVQKKAAAAEKKVAKAAKQAAAASVKAKGHKEKAPKVTPKDVKDGNAEKKPLSLVKIEKFWLEPLLTFIKKNGCDANGEKIPEIDMLDAQLARTLIVQIQKGYPHILKILVSHYRKKNTKN